VPGKERGCERIVPHGLFKRLAIPLIVRAVKNFLSLLTWLAVAALGAGAYATIAFQRGEPLNSVYILLAALCTYALGYRFYSKWIAARVLMLDEQRATPCEVHEDGKDYVKTNKWIVFGHHFAAISGPGPLVGPVLAAQFGYLPGTLWILIGVVLGGAVQDFVILFASVRRDGRSLAQMVKEELSTLAGTIGVVAILSILTILLAVLGLVVVKALAESPWGVFTVAATIPIAMLMGGYLRFFRIGKVLEVSVIGAFLLLLAVWGGQFVHSHPEWSEALKFSEMQLAWGIILYGLLASTLPVWLLLAPRDYLSTFMKLGTIVALALGCCLILPDLQMPAVTKFVDGSGLVVAGKLFPFCFITIACGAISGFHTLIASGITPKIITRESHIRSIGYGAMCLESFVAIMAMIAACTLDPGVYLAMNVKGSPEQVIAKVQSSGLMVFGEGSSQTAAAVSDTRMRELAAQVGENSLYGRTGGAATLAVGMAQLFSRLTQGRWLDLWYHFAIMFEALFILTTVDAGTRVGRYLLQDALSHVWKPLGDLTRRGPNLLASALMVAAWGYFLIQGVLDPLGGVNSLWPLFGIANQLLAAIALCLATTIILKMQLGKTDGTGRPAFALITFIPLLCLLAITFTAGFQKIYDPSPRVGFLAAARELDAKLPPDPQAVGKELGEASGAAIAAAEKALRTNRALHFNNLLDAAVAQTFLVLVTIIILISLRQWFRLFSGAASRKLTETEPVRLSAGALEREKPLPALGLAVFGFTLIKELSGQAAVDRAQAVAETCDCAAAQTRRGRANVFLSETERRFTGINRCC
jgi:carbon starvation protein